MRYTYGYLIALGNKNFVQTVFKFSYFYQLQKLDMLIKYGVNYSSGHWSEITYNCAGTVLVTFSLCFAWVEKKNQTCRRLGLTIKVGKENNINNHLLSYCCRYNQYICNQKCNSFSWYLWNCCSWWKKNTNVSNNFFFICTSVCNQQNDFWYKFHLLYSQSRLIVTLYIYLCQTLNFSHIRVFLWSIPSVNTYFFTNIRVMAWNSLGPYKFFFFFSTFLFVLYK